MLSRSITSLVLGLLLLALAEAQSQGPFAGEPPGRQVSARLDQLTGDDPTGKAAVLASLGNPVQYVGIYPYIFEPPMVGQSAGVDPNIVTPVPGNNAATNGSFKVVGNTGSIAAHAIPFPNDLVLFLIRPNSRNDFGGETTSLTNETYLLVDNSTRVEAAALYNLTDNTYVPFHITESPLCSAHTLLQDGTAYIAGGMMVGINAPYYTIGYQAVRRVDATVPVSTLVNEFPTGRWYPSVMTLPDGTVLVVGGAQIELIGWGTSSSPLNSGTPLGTDSPSTVQCSGNAGNQQSDPSYGTPTYAILSPTDNSLSRQLTLSILLEAWPVSTYPFLAVMPSGSTLIVAGVQMEALFMDVEGAEPDDAIGPLPQLPYPPFFPQQGSLVLLPLSGPDYRTQVLIAGGSSQYCATAKTPGTNTTILVDVTPGANHSLVQEQAHFPRVMGDAILLPDGRVFLCNGAQEGIAGGSAYGFSAATNGATVAEIYDPSQPIGSRWSVVADSQIWRLYHSTAFLTNNAEVFVGGSETTSEHRAQIYTPGYLQNGKPRPAITSSPPTAGYQANFSIGFSGVPSLDRIVLNRLASATHGNHFDQRQVVLNCSDTGNTATCRSPPNSSVAPPGIYQLFVLYQGVPSRANLISLSSGVAPPEVDSNLGSGLAGPTQGLGAPAIVAGDTAPAPAPAASRGSSVVAG